MDTLETGPSKYISVSPNSCMVTLAIACSITCSCVSVVWFYFVSSYLICTDATEMESLSNNKPTFCCLSCLSDTLNTLNPIPLCPWTIHIACTIWNSNCDSFHAWEVQLLFAPGSSTENRPRFQSETWHGLDLVLPLRLLTGHTFNLTFGYGFPYHGENFPAPGFLHDL